jgi:hypothetical protein
MEMSLIHPQKRFSIIQYYPFSNDKSDSYDNVTYTTTAAILMKLTII